jgi:hypothetical protein
VVLLTVAPWTVRNWIVYHAVVPVSTAGALNLWQGNARLSRQEVYDRYAAVHGRIEKYRFAQSMGVRAILDRQPAWIFEKLASEMPLFWEADSLALIHIRRGAYGDVGLATGAAAAVAVLVPYLLVVGLFVVGAAAAPFTRGTVMLSGFLVYYTLIHVATHGFARYRLPAMPVLFLFAGWAWTAWRSRALPHLGPSRKVLAVALGLTLALSVAPSLTTEWMGPKHTPSEDGGVPAE